MGNNVLAICDEQLKLEENLKSFGLRSNIRDCNIDSWKDAFELCTGLHVDHLQYATISSDIVKLWSYESARLLMNSVPGAETEEHVIPMYKYLNVCAIYSACLFIYS